MFERGQDIVEMKRRLCFYKAVIATLLLLILLVIFLLYISNHFLTCTYYTISNSKLLSPFRVVQLSDIHGSSFGLENDKLIQKVRENDPDIIIITGDIINDKEKNQNTIISKVNTLLSKLK